MASIYSVSPFLALCFLELVLRASGAPVPAIFVFGDSTVDVGNNNYLKNCSLNARADYPRYGVDFANSTPTGRFSNGYNTADYLARLLGFPMSPPPYLSLTTDASIANQMLNYGVNFASGGAGLLDTTGQVYGEVISASAQLQHFSSAVELLRTAHGTAGTAEHLARSLFFISIGSNDMFEYSYFRSAAGAVNDTAFLSGLVATYSGHLRALYDLGARKFSVASVPLPGCCPSQRARGAGAGCFEALNDMSRRFYEMVGEEMLPALSRDAPGMRYSLGNADAIVSFVSDDPELFGRQRRSVHRRSYVEVREAMPPEPDPLTCGGFKEVKAACCGSGTFGESGCNATAPVCANRDDQWRRHQSGEAMARMAAMFLYYGYQPYVDPINVQELSAM